jgi:hypothetical protein
LKAGLCCFLVVVINLSLRLTTRRNLNLLPGPNSWDHYTLNTPVV